MPKPLSKKVLLIGWDAADWKIINPLIEAGKMPALERLINKGVMGNIATLNPVLSPMLWTSIATGVRPFRHGIHGFTEPDPLVGGVRPVSNQSRKVKAIWNMLNQEGLKSNVVGWWPSHPAEPIDGVMVSNLFQRPSGPIDQPWHMPPGAVHPERLFADIANLRIHPTEITAEQILPFIPKAAEIDPEQDPRLGALCRILADCSSVHAAATALMQLEPWDFMAVYYDAIDHFGHGFMKYHPPRRAHIPEEEYEYYKGVVEGGYRFHDMMLGVLMELAGKDTTIILVSDHGFHPDHLRPARIPNEPAGPAVEHRPYGIFVMSGPGIKKDELVFGTSLLDVTPTILTLFGLPVGQDMHGKALLQAFENTPEIKTITSWETRGGKTGRHPNEVAIDPIAAQEAIKQLAALGYIETAGEDQEKAVQTCLRENTFNLARDYIDANRHSDALPLLEQLWQDNPEELRFADYLAHCYLALKRLDKCRPLLEQLFVSQNRLAQAAQKKLATFSSKDDFSETEKQEIKRLLSLASPGSFGRDYLMGSLLAAENKPDEALKHLRCAAQAAPHLPDLHIQIGNILNKKRDWDAAEKAFKQALTLDPDSHYAYLGLCKNFILSKKNRAAADAALSAIGLLYHLPQAHYLLGRALLRLAKPDSALEAFKVAVSQHPGLIAAHEKLAYIYEHHLNDPKKARQCHERIRTIRQQKEKKQQAPQNDTTSQAKKVKSWDKKPTGISHLAQENETITIVSGLPRSGTSMMMQMLAAGGYPCLSDNSRAADKNNPKGYFELEKVKRLATNSSWLPAAQGMALKVVAPLLPYLPQDYPYRVIFMQRELNEIIASQQQMINGQTQISPATKLKETYEQQLEQINTLLKERHISVLYLDYQDTLTHPAAAATLVKAFISDTLDLDKMIAAIDKKLCHQYDPSLQVTSYIHLS